ncbi:probable inactive histone-lysine N-methyltransferase SUVR2 isoform X3 [Rhodamnia argentea]|nr:probable inactive histone-lysine N-methyltransferase SUVR2 isoform X3 [Rhodamnia argentea]XP_048137906.1 probable inactive histone-lysine N-methyltransferase SUVR2 isoform X3 [Rhodamnia argentea]
MAPNPRVKAAFMAMRDIGISEDKLKPVLKKLLKVYDKKWELIEEENYRVLADAIFDEEDDKVEVQKRKSTADEDDLEEEAQMHEVERPLKRLRLRNQESQGLASPSNQNSQLGGTSFQPVVEQQEIQSSSVQQNNMDKGKQPISPMALAVIERNNLSLLSTIKASGTRSVMSSDTSIRILIDKGKGPLSPHFIDRSFIHERPCNEPKDETYGLAVWHLEMKPCFWVGAEMCWRGWLGLTVAGTSWKGSQVIGSSTDDDRYS